MAGKLVSEADKQLFDEHALVGQRMLSKIPRLETVAEIVAYQGKCFDGSGVPNDDVAGRDIPIGARILKVAADFDVALKSHQSTTDAVATLEQRTGHYDPAIVEALRKSLLDGLCSATSQEISIGELRVGMVLAADIRSTRNPGQLMLTRGQTITETVKQKLQMLRVHDVICDHCCVEVLGAVVDTVST